MRDSVEKTGYSAPGNISGYIVGKENIDTSKERAEVERLEGELSSSFARIEAAVTSVRNEVKASGVGSNLGGVQGHNRREYPNRFTSLDGDLFRPAGLSQEAVQHSR